MSIPMRYQDASYDDVPKNIKDLYENMRTTRKGIFIHGSVGTGKTHIIYALKKHWDQEIAQGSEFWNTTELLREIKDEFDRGVYDKRRVVEKLMESTRLLFLDDIGSEKSTEFVQETFYLLINRRYNDMRPVIFTSNFSLAELSARIGDRTVSRIVELCDIVALNGQDRRLAKRSPQLSS